MTRLIDADELKEYVGREALDTREKIFALVDRMPTVEARPHGEWIECETMIGNKVCVCSICKRVFGVNIDKSKPCPNCGSKMLDKRQEGE